MNVIGVDYEVKEVAHVPENYQLPVVKLLRDDGVAGWLEVKGPGADEMQPGDVVVIHKRMRGTGG